MTQKSNLVLHAEKELDLLLGGNEVTLDGMNAAMKKDILSVVKTFSKQGHSGFSAAYAIGVLEKLLRFEPLKPLTGEDSEWMAVGEEDDDVMYQNVRYSAVFKLGKYGSAYDINAVVFRRGKDGATFTKGGYRHYITFPYTPSTKVVTIPKWQFWR